MTTLQPKLNVAFVGKIAAGKTTAAEYLSEKYGYTRVHFASTIKSVAQQIWPDQEIDGDREKLQGLGVSVRQLDEDAWVNLALRDIDVKTGGPYVVDDCRFPNEYWKLKGEGFITVRIVAPEGLRANRAQAIGRLQNLAQLKHESEIALDDYTCDFNIENPENDLDAFHTLIDNTLRKAEERAY